MKVLGIALAAAVLWSESAHAHWQNTRWGMTEAEVRAVWPAAQEREDSGSFALKIEGPVQIGGTTYKTIRSVFDTKGKLRQVHLEAAEHFDVLRERMASQMGAPITEEDKPFILGDARTKQALFRDTAKGNSVKLWAISGGAGPTSTLLTYRSLESGF